MRTVYSWVLILPHQGCTVNLTLNMPHLFLPFLPVQLYKFGPLIHVTSSFCLAWWIFPNSAPDSLSTCLQVRFEHFFISTILLITSGFNLLCSLWHCWIAAISWLLAHFDRTSSIIPSWCNCLTKSSPKSPIPCNHRICSTRWSSIAWTFGEILWPVPLHKPIAVSTDFFKCSVCYGSNIAENAWACENMESKTFRRSLNLSRYSMNSCWE